MAKRAGGLVAKWRARWSRPSNESVMNLGNSVSVLAGIDSSALAPLTLATTIREGAREFRQQRIKNCHANRTHFRRGC